MPLILLLGRLLRKDLLKISKVFFASDALFISLVLVLEYLAVRDLLQNFGLDVSLLHSDL